MIWATIAAVARFFDIIVVEKFGELSRMVGRVNYI